MIAVRTNPSLLSHLQTFEVDGATVDSLLFEGGRLAYPGRKEIEYELGYADPYTLAMEARVIEGLSKRANAAIRLLAREADDHLLFSMEDSTLELLWRSHGSWTKGISLDRLVAALVMVEYALDGRTLNADVERAAEILVTELHRAGFPPTRVGLEELFDGAAPACVGLGLVEL